MKFKIEINLCKQVGTCDEQLPLRDPQSATLPT